MVWIRQTLFDITAKGNSVANVHKYIYYKGAVKLIKMRVLHKNTNEMETGHGILGINIQLRIW